MRKAAAILAAISVCTSGWAASVRKDFTNIWSAREADYAAADQGADKSERDTATKLLDSYKTNGPSLLTDFQSCMGATYGHSLASARYKLLKEFEAFMATKPTASGAQAWMQGKIAQVQPVVAPAAAEEARLTRVKVGVDEQAPQWIQEKAHAAQVSGMLAGLVAELTLIDQNLRSFYEGLSGEQARAAETRRAILGGWPREWLPQRVRHRLHRATSV